MPYRRPLSRISLFWQLLIPSVLAAVLCMAMVQAWTLQVSQRELEARMQSNLSASMALLKAYLSPLGGGLVPQRGPADARFHARARP